MIRARAILHRLCFIICLNLLIYASLSKFGIPASLTFMDNVLLSRKSIQSKNAQISTAATTKVSFNTEKIISDPAMQVKLRSGLLQPKEAFVTFSNNAPTYLALLKVLLDSVHAFSTRPIIAYGIDVDLDIDVNQYPRVIIRRIKQRDCGPVIGFELSIIMCFYETFSTVLVGLFL